ncbi:MAG: hypothetical protein RJB38_1209 [Pseudomonadota bacterium]|jgi:hypothetical protein
MKKTFTKTLALTLTLSTLALVASATKAAQASSREQREQYGLTLLTSAFVTSFPFFYSADLTSRDMKIAAAHAAIEDVAAYYETGRLTGILPSVLENTKSILAAERGVSATEITDAEAVDHIASVAEQALK